MPDKSTPESESTFLSRLGLFETLILAAICLVAFAGLLMMGKGFMIKAKEQIAADPATYLNMARGQ